jgi:predicted negative regulator of RcsB-dependent stress response
MDKETKHETDLYQLVAWAHANRKRLIAGLVAVLIAGGVIGLTIWNKSHHELMANEALANIKDPPGSREHPTAADAAPYVQVANDYQGTAAAARARLMAGGALFEAGNFKDAGEQFNRFLQENPSHPLANEALLGVAASLEGDGKNADAIARYEDLIKHHMADTTGPQAKSALARLYLAENRPEEALPLYDELARGNNNESWALEAEIGRQELYTKYPNLKKPPVRALTPSPGPLLTNSTLLKPQ